MQIVAASDHAELEAEVSGTVVNRITFDGDRIAQVIRAPGGFPHNPAAAWLGAPAKRAICTPTLWTRGARARGRCCCSRAWRRSVSVARPTT